jgi:hypothetical protein
MAMVTTRSRVKDMNAPPLEEPRCWVARPRFYRGIRSLRLTGRPTSLLSTRGFHVVGSEEGTLLKALVQSGRANKNSATSCKSNCTDQKEFTCKAHSTAGKKHSDRVGMTIEGVPIRRTAKSDPNSLHMQRAALHMHGTYLHAFVSWGGGPLGRKSGPGGLVVFPLFDFLLDGPPGPAPPY